MKRIWIGVGSNIDAPRNLRRGVMLLREHLGDLRLSPVFETEAFGFEGDAFLNMVVGAGTEFSPGELAALLRGIEDRCGRRRGAARFSARTLDLDLLTYGAEAGEIDGVQLPHPDALNRDFTLAPLAAVAGDERVPGGDDNWEELWARMGGAESKPRRIDFDWREAVNQGVG